MNTAAYRAARSSPAEARHPGRILVVAPAWVGDMVMAEAVTQLLQQRHPGAAIDLLAPPWTAPLASFMPAVRRAVISPFAHGQLALAARWRLARQLRKEGYDVAILLPNSLKAALAPFFAGIPRRVGYTREGRALLLTEARWLDKARLSRQVDRFFALVLPDGAPLPPDLPTPRLAIPAGAVESALASLGLVRPSAPLLILAPGAEYGPAKRWPAEHFGMVARERHASGWSVWLVGSSNDREAAAAAQAASGGICVDLAGRTDLAQAVALMSLAGAVVSNDSGLMHVAAALARPLVALYGPSDPGFTPPLSPQARLLRLALDCSPCHARECPLGHQRCLVELAPERVLEALTALEAAR